MQKVLEGKVVSVKMQNTLVVEVTRRVPHPLYKKLMKRTRRFKVHNTNDAIKLGDTIKFISIRKIAKDKNFKVLEGKK